METTLIDDLDQILKQPETLEQLDRRTNRLTANLRRHVKDAVAAGLEWHRLQEQQAAASRNGDAARTHQISERARVVHHHRCVQLRAVAYLARRLMRLAAMGLTIDISTADTSLDICEREMIEGVQGKDDVNGL